MNDSFVYARLEDFGGIVHHLMQDETPQPFTLSTADQLVVFSMLLSMYASPDIPDHALPKIHDLCRRLADAMIARFPFCEGYLDFLFGAAAMSRELHVK